MKIRNLLTLILTGAFVAGFSGAAYLKKPDESSVSERRLLAQFPTVSPLDPAFSSKFDSYATDQFPLRDIFRSIKASTAVGVLRQLDNHNVYVVDGSASEIDYPLSESKVSYAAGRVNYVISSYVKGNSKAYFAVIPDKNAFLAKANGYPAYDFEDLRSLFASEIQGAQEIEIADLLDISDFYKTDTHWSQEKILPVARKIASSMGVELSAEYREVTLDTPFYGVYRGRSALSLSPDRLTYLTNDFLDNLKVTDGETGQEIPVYELSYADGRDPYEMFLSGSKSLLTIENPNAENDRSLVIIRDSFGSSLSPLLFEGWKKVTVVDIRYLMPEVLGRFVDFENSDVLFIYSASVLNNSETIK